MLHVLQLLGNLEDPDPLDGSFRGSGWMRGESSLWPKSIHPISWLVYHLVNSQFAIENGHEDIVDLRMKRVVIVNGYLSLPEGRIWPH